MKNLLETASEWNQESKPLADSKEFPIKCNRCEQTVVGIWKTTKANKRWIWESAKNSWHSCTTSKTNGTWIPDQSLTSQPQVSDSKFESCTELTELKKTVSSLTYKVNYLERLVKALNLKSKLEGSYEPE